MFDVRLWQGVKVVSVLRYRRPDSETIQATYEDKEANTTTTNSEMRKPRR